MSNSWIKKFGSADQRVGGKHRILERAKGSDSKHILGGGHKKGGRLARLLKSLINEN